MKTLSSVTTLAVALTAAIAFAQSPAKPAAGKTLTGVVSDSMCGAKHMAKDKSPAECTRACIKVGSDYALVASDKVYSLKGGKTELDKYAGQRVTVKGTVDGNNVNVQSIAATKAAGHAGKMDSGHTQGTSEKAQGSK